MNLQTSMGFGGVCYDCGFLKCDTAWFFACNLLVIQTNLRVCKEDLLLSSCQYCSNVMLLLLNLLLSKCDY